MKNLLSKIVLISIITIAAGRYKAQSDHFRTRNPYYSNTAENILKVDNSEWKKILQPELYQVAREGATETAFTGKYDELDEKGTYYCAVCGHPLFLSTSKFATTCGWPSFYQPIRKNSVKYKKDTSHHMERIEVVCGRCNSHLGHIFDDGPQPIGKRFCMNSICLDFRPINKKISDCLTDTYEIFHLFSIQNKSGLVNDIKTQINNNSLKKSLQ